MKHACSFIVVACAAHLCPPAFAGGLVINEVLFHVPKGAAGDANKDGSRSATGDEFVEIRNTSGAPIQLEGYTLCNRLTARDADAKIGIRFVFPAFELGPDEIVVVFNGHESEIAGPLGNADEAPMEPNSQFHDAWVFSMETSKRNRAFSNAGDFVVLIAPDGSAADCVHWGAPEPAPPGGSVEVKKNPKGSVQRPGEGEDHVPHASIDARACSPGAAT